MTYKLETQIELSKKAIEMERKRIKNWEKEFELKKKRAEDRIEVMENKVRLIENRLKDKSSKKEGVLKISNCLGCGIKIRYGCKFCSACRREGEKIMYYNRKSEWDNLSKKGQLRKMENLSKNLLNNRNELMGEELK